MLSVQPIDVSLALGLTIGDSEVVGAFANCLFQIWHGMGVLLTKEINLGGAKLFVNRSGMRFD